MFSITLPDHPLSLSAHNVRFLFGGHLGRCETSDCDMHSKIEALRGLDGLELNPCLGLGCDHPARTNWDPPAVPLWNDHLDAVEVSLGAPALLARLQAILCQPAVDFVINLLLRQVHTRTKLISTADHVEG